MKTFKKIRGWFSNPWRVFVWPFVKMVRGIVPDEWYVRIQRRVKMGYRLDLDHPKTLDEKLQWLKLYNRRPEYTQMVEQVGAKEYAAGIVYDHRTELLLREEIGEYDVILNAIMWDSLRRDHIIRREDLHRMKHGSMIIDISCDRNGAIETSMPTTTDNPTYMVDGIRHYVVDHTPALFFKTTSESLSCEVARYLDHLIEGDESCAVLNNALIVREGKIIDPRINKFQNR